MALEEIQMNRQQRRAARSKKGSQYRGMKKLNSQSLKWQSDRRKRND
jgi:hypothetical protein